MLSDILFILLWSLLNCLIFSKSSLLVVPMPLLNLFVCYCIYIFVHLFLLFVSSQKLLSPFLSILGYYYWGFFACITKFQICICWRGIWVMQLSNSLKVTKTHACCLIHIRRHSYGCVVSPSSPWHWSVQDNISLCKVSIWLCLHKQNDQKCAFDYPHLLCFS